jgi:hypothetical protein
MLATMKILTGAAGLAAAVGLATPASAQYYPQPGYPQQGYPQPGYGYGNPNPVDQVLGQILGYGRYPYGNYGYNQYANQSMAVDQCARAVERRLNSYRGGYYGYGNVPYGGYNQGYGNQYGYNQGYGGGRVQGITRVERKNYGLKVWGVATSGYRGYQGYGNNRYGTYGYGAGADLSFDCEVRYDGRIRDIDIKRRTANWRGY